MTEFTEICSGLRFPEGPIAMADGSFLVVEIERGTLSHVSRNGTVSPVAKPGGGPNGAAIGPDGACYLCNNGGFKWHYDGDGMRPVLQAEDYAGGRIERVDLETGEVRILYTGVGEINLRGPNDIVFDADGGFWFTDRGKVRAREEDRGAVFYAKPDGSFIAERIYPMTSPNGIGLSQDGRTLYVAETTPGRLWAFDLDGPGKIRKHPWPSPHGGRLVAGLPGYQLFDSLALDSDDNICVATLMNGAITVISPNGASVEQIPMPDTYTTNICFGGKDLRTAYVTLSTSGRLVALDWPRPGAKLNFLNP